MDDYIYVNDNETSLWAKSSFRVGFYADVYVTGRETHECV